MEPDNASFTVDGWDFSTPMTLSEVASKFHVSAATVNRWRRNGHLTVFKTLGGHHRYSAQQVEALLKSINPTAVTTVAPVTGDESDDESDD